MIGAALCAPPIGTSYAAGRLTLTLVLLVLGLAALLPYVLRAFGHSRAELTMVCAGLAFGWSGVATKLAADDLSNHHLLLRRAVGPRDRRRLGRRHAERDRARCSRAPRSRSRRSCSSRRPSCRSRSRRCCSASCFSDTPLGGVPLVASLLRARRRRRRARALAAAASG